jgi:hypothetical protein
LWHLLCVDFLPAVRRAAANLFQEFSREMSAAEALQQEIKQQGETVKALKAEKKVRYLSIELSINYVFPFVLVLNDSSC